MPVLESACHNLGVEYPGALTGGAITSKVGSCSHLKSRTHWQRCVLITVLQYQGVIQVRLRCSVTAIYWAHLWGALSDMGLEFQFWTSSLCRSGERCRCNRNGICGAEHWSSKVAAGHSSSYLPNRDLCGNLALEKQRCLHIIAG